jgi:hypothetical protein
MKRFLTVFSVLFALAMMPATSSAAAVFFDHFFDTAHEGGFNLLTDSFKLILSNGAPSAAWTDDSEITSELSTANGYTQGGETMTVVSSSQTSGTYTWVGSAVEWTLSGEISFRYAILNDTTADMLICYWDYGSAQTPSSSLTINIGTILTVSFSMLDRYRYLDFIVPGLKLKAVFDGDVKIFRNAA